MSTACDFPRSSSNVAQSERRRRYQASLEATKAIETAMLAGEDVGDAGKAPEEETVWADDTDVIDHSPKIYSDPLMTIVSNCEVSEW
jgi:hypothetical protein